MNIKKLEKVVSHELGKKYKGMMDHGLSKTMDIGLKKKAEDFNPCKGCKDSFCPGPNECMYWG